MKFAKTNGVESERRNIHRHRSKGVQWNSRGKHKFEKKNSSQYQIQNYFWEGKRVRRKGGRAKDVKKILREEHPSRLIQPQGKGSEGFVIQGGRNKGGVSGSSY